MKNKVIFLLAVLVLLLAACAPAPTQSPPTATPEPSPTPEPLGPRVVFVSNRGGDKNSSQLYILDVECGEITLLDTGFDNVVFPK